MSCKRKEKNVAIFFAHKMNGRGSKKREKESREQQLGKNGRSLGQRHAYQHCMLSFRKRVANQLHRRRLETALLFGVCASLLSGILARCIYFVAVISSRRKDRLPKCLGNGVFCCIHAANLNKIASYINESCQLPDRHFHYFRTKKPFD